MILPLLLLTLLPLFLPIIASNAATSSTYDPFRLDLLTLPSLTFIASTLTTSRRHQPHPQLLCVTGDACPDQSNLPIRVDCYNSGLAPGDHPPRPKWNCVAVTTPAVTVAEWVVRCEGFSGPEDPFVLKDSCWLQYDLRYAAVAPVVPEETVVNIGGVHPHRHLGRAWGISAFLAGIALIACCMRISPRVREQPGESAALRPVISGYDATSRVR